MGEHQRRKAEIATLKEQAHEVSDRIAGFSSGLQVAAGCMQLVLARKVALSILTEETAKAIFEGVGKEIEDAIDRAFPKQNETPA